MVICDKLIILHAESGFISDSTRQEVIHIAGDFVFYSV